MDNEEDRMRKTLLVLPVQYICIDLEGPRIKNIPVEKTITRHRFD
jgi:hypothetical protein